MKKISITPLFCSGLKNIKSIPLDLSRGMNKMAEAVAVNCNFNTGRSEKGDYVVPRELKAFNDKVKDKGIAIVQERVYQLRRNLSVISGFLFDRTNDKLPDDKQLTIEKYDGILTDHIGHIIESDEDIKSLLNKIIDSDEDAVATE